jgi:hypothetical protein
VQNWRIKHTTIAQADLKARLISTGVVVWKDLVLFTILGWYEGCLISDLGVHYCRGYHVSTSPNTGDFWQYLRYCFFPNITVIQHAITSCA